MKIVTLGIFTLLTIVTQAQSEIEVRYSYAEWDVVKNKPKGDKHTVNIYIQKRNGKQLVESLSFGEREMSEKHVVYKSNGEIKKLILRQSNDSNKVTEFKAFKNGKLYQMQTYSYLDFTYFSGSAYYYKDSITPKITYSCDYYPNHKPKSNTTYNQQHKQVSRYEYDYYENGSNKETRYFHKTKLKHTWVYDCNWKGELENAKTAKICEKRVYDTDSSFTEIFESTFHQKIYRTIVKSTRDGRVIENTSLDAKGRQQSKSMYQYNTAGKLIKHIKYKGNSNKPQFIELFEYDSDTNLMASIHINRSGVVKSRKEYSYN